jgi:putative phosphoesterase
MKLALLGDIHSNYKALERCLSYCEEEGVDGFLFLGDYISDCPYPGKTLELIRNVCTRYPYRMIRGNRESYQLMHQESSEEDWSYCSNSGSLLYTYENLTSEDLNLFRECEISQTVSMEGYPVFTICHGSPSSDRELLHIGSELTKQRLLETETDLLICAHTHIQGRYDYAGKTLINPGSVGIAVGVAGQAQFAILHGEQKCWRVEFLSLDYDIDQLIREYNESDLPAKSKTFAKLIQYELITGDNILPEVYRLTEEHTRKAYGYIPSGNLPDEFWESAYHQMMKEKQRNNMKKIT